MSKAWHPDESQLLSFADGELDRPEAGAIERHLSECSDCRATVEAFRASYAAYASTTKRGMPPPPRPWVNLRTELKRLDAGRVPSRRQPFFRVDLRWMAGAAALVVGAFIFRLSSGTVSAAELLRDASAAEVQRPAQPKRSIRVKTRRAVFTRPAAVRPAESEPEIAGLFKAANYSWEEPLSARSFARWRNQLNRKVDGVRILRDSEFGRGRHYRITTSTGEGVLEQASITIRASDLRAVHETFRFRNNEEVEITEEPVVRNWKPFPPEQLAEEPSVPRRPEAPRPLTPADELKVIAALHAIGADLGEPVEVTRTDSSIVVSALATDAERQSQIRTALSGLSYVDLRFEQPESVRTDALQLRRAPEAGPPKSNALLELLAGKLGSRSTVENFTNHTLDLSETALARAHALRSLAERFPPDAERQLSRDDTAVLQRIQATHTKYLLAAVRQLSELLQPLAAESLPQGDAASFYNWQAGAEIVLDAARRVDRTLTNALAGSGVVEDPDEALTNLARAASDLHGRVAALQTVVARVDGQ